MEVVAKRRRAKRVCGARSAGGVVVVVIRWDCVASQAGLGWPVVVR